MIKIGFYISFLFLGKDHTTLNSNSAPVLNETTIDKVTSSQPNTQQSIAKQSITAILMNTTVYPFRHNKLFHCFYCPQTFLDMPPLVDHNNTAHSSLSEGAILKATRKGNPIKVNVEEFGCKLCGVKTEDFNELQTHLIVTHNYKIDVKQCGVIPLRIKGNHFECMHCNRKFVKYKLLVEHVKQHYSNHFCDQCGAVFITEHTLKNHLGTHQVGSFPCSVCNKMFKNQISLMQHIKVIHKKAKRNICGVCDQAFRNYYDKLKHMMEDHGIQVPEYKCTYCPRVFILNAHWRAHEKTHIKPNTYTCDLCQYKHHDKTALRRHMVVHSDERKFKCEVCKKAYARGRTLKEHMRIHNNDRRFACGYCTKAFVQKCSLKGHMRTHHKDAPPLQ